METPDASRTAARRRITLRDYLPGTRAGRVFALSTLMSAFGTGLFLAGSTVFFVREAGLTRVELGAGLGIAAFAGLAATVPIGALADRLGAQPTLVGALLWRALCFVALAFVHGPLAFTVVASCQAAAQNATGPVTQALIGSVTEESDRTRTMAVVRTVRNIGFSLGALAATPLLLADGHWLSRSILIGNAAAFVVSALLLAGLRTPRPVKAAAFRNPLAAVRAFGDWRYLCLTALNSGLTLHMTLLAVGLPLWVTEHDGAPDALVPALILVNTVLAVLLQVPFARDVSGARAGARALRRAGLALAGCAALLAVPVGAPSSVAVVAVLLACALLTGGELWQAAGGWELSYAYAPEERKNLYLAVFSLGTSVQDMAGPLLITGVVLALGGPGWLLLAAFFAGLAVLAGVTVPLLERRPAAPAPSVPSTTG
ncbi:MFS transporter [Streptomyces sp. NBC_00102]|uniref:MFS transporter n=1 Tax=Streptomyces sp. NBC_00102 TaxID=2975652 RepID=UPI00224E5F8C|nr:MFS transporter [Streptomyces sp. NBC_00102]MCX5399489.1 MFS transporter [Streptomyces sp. NBC_00102]